MLSTSFLQTRYTKYINRFLGDLHGDTPNHFFGVIAPRVPTAPPSVNDWTAGTGNYEPLLGGACRYNAWIKRFLQTMVDIWASKVFSSCAKYLSALPVNDYPWPTEPFSLLEHKFDPQNWGWWIPATVTRTIKTDNRINPYHRLDHLFDSQEK